MTDEELFSLYESATQQAFIGSNMSEYECEVAGIRTVREAIEEKHKEHLFGLIDANLDTSDWRMDGFLEAVGYKVSNG